MSDKPKQENRIPFENLQKGQEVSLWSLPSIENKARLVFSAKKESRENASNGEVIDNYPGMVKPKPMTAEELQKMTAEAKKEGFDQGYNEGLTAGMREGAVKGEQQGRTKAYRETKQQLDEDCTRLRQIASNLLEPMQGQEALLEKIIVDMAVQFAQRLIEKEIRQAPESIIRIANKALSALPSGSSGISVFVNCNDAVLIDEYFPPENRSWILKTDSSIASGGCRVETDESLVDYTVESRLRGFLEQVSEHDEVGNTRVSSEYEPSAEEEQVNRLTNKREQVPAGDGPDNPT